MRIWKSKFFHGLMALILTGAIAMVIMGVRDLKTEPSEDISAYNSAVNDLYFLYISVSPIGKYCTYDPDYLDDYDDVCFRGGAAIKRIMEDRALNFENIGRFSEVLLEIDDPLISSRVMYNIGTMLLLDALTFRDERSLTDATLALQNSLRDDPHYLDTIETEVYFVDRKGYSSKNGPTVFPVNKRINLALAILIRDALDEGTLVWPKFVEDLDAAGDGAGDGAGASSRDKNWKP